MKKIFLLLLAGVSLILSGCAQQNQNVVIKGEAIDTITKGPSHGTIEVSVPKESLIGVDKINIVSMPYSRYQKFIGGGYTLLPQGRVLAKPAYVKITYTETAANLYKENNPKFSNTNLTLAYYDNKKGSYAPLESSFDPSSKTVTGYISTFYDVIAIIEKPAL